MICSFPRDDVKESGGSISLRRVLDSTKSAVLRVVASERVIRRASSKVLSDGTVTVLMYHTLSGDQEPQAAWTAVRTSDFLRQVEWLRKRYCIVSLEEALLGAVGNVEAPKVVLTFDDGEAGLHRLLLPMIERESLPVTVYVATEQVESGRPYWFDRLINAAQVGKSAKISLPDGLTVKLLPVDERGAWKSIAKILAYLKALDAPAREVLTSDLAHRLRAVPLRKVTPLRPLNRHELAELAASPWVTIGAHTHGHELLNQIEPEVARATIETSRRLLEDWTGRQVDHFAYPNGNHNPLLVEMVRDLGFRSAMSTRHGVWSERSERFLIPRVPVGRYDDIARFKLALLGGSQKVLRMYWGGA